MKDFYFLVCVVGFSVTGAAQNIVFPDPNFKLYMLLTCNCDNDADGEITYQEAATLDFAHIEDEMGLEIIYDLTGLEHFTGMTNLILKNLGDVTATPDLSSMTQLSQLEITECAFSGTLDLSANTQLQYLEIVQTGIQGTLDLSQNINLSGILINGTQIDNIMLGGNSLGEVDLQNNQLSNLSISGEAPGMLLDISYNQFTNIDFFQNIPQTGYGTFYFFDAQLPAYLDLQSMPKAGNIFMLSSSTSEHVKIPPGLDWFESFSVYGENLKTVDMKNGYFDGGWSLFSPWWNAFGFGGPNLQWICVDDYTLGDESTGTLDRSERNHLLQNNTFASNVFVGSYCDLTSGPNIITGATNANCPDQTPLSGVQFSIFGGGWSTFSDQNGNFTLYGDPGPVTVTPQISNPDWFNVSPPSVSLNFSDYDQSATANFCITPNGVHPDLEVSILPITPARPGFNSDYLIKVRNQGTFPLTGQAVFTYDDAVFDYVSATPTASIQSPGSMTWDFQDLQPLSDTSFSVVLNLNGPMETPAVNIGDELDFTANVTPVANDETPLNNSDGLKQDVVGSFDPNDKQVLEGEMVNITQVGEFLNYLVRFQNTGTAAAEFVVVKDSISDKLDMNTFEVVAASHQMRTNITYVNEVEFIFDNINLPPSSQDEPGSNGYVAFRIRPKSTVVLNDVIENKADIFFDFNFPIVTNTVSTTFMTLGVAESASTSFSVHPNPVSSTLNISARDAISTLEILNLLGQRVMSANCDSQREISADVSELPSGVYLAKIVTSGGKSVKRFVKN